MNEPYNYINKIVTEVEESRDDIADLWNTATQQSEALIYAYIRGVEDGIKKERNRIKDVLGMRGEDR